MTRVSWRGGVAHTLSTSWPVLWPAVWSLALALLVLGPALAPGYVLTYDMVWVPELALRPDFLGSGSGLPRAVPSDAVVAVLDTVVPGMLLQKVVLVGALVAAGAGAAALVPDLSVPARLAASTLVVWNPFVVERLVIGHWPVLVGYAALPWLAIGARRVRGGGSVPGWLLLVLAVGSLSASAGLASALVVMAFGASRAWRRTGVLALAVALANAPWVVAGVLHAGDALSDASGADAFALRGEGLLPAPVTALGLGGIWNSEVVPATREGFLAVVGLAVLLALCAAGARGWWDACVARDRVALVVCWTVGWGVAVASWAATDAFGLLAAEVPGGGLLRDGSRLLGLCAPLVAVLVAHGVDGVRAALGGTGSATLTAVLLALVPVAVMPDAGWGVSGRLHATDYPDAWAQAREVVGDADGTDVLVLPFTSYRAPTWNDGTKVLSPMGRYLRPDYVASDELVVSGRTLAGEDARGAQVRRALAQPDAASRAAALAGLGIGTVVVERDAPGDVPDVAGRRVLDTGMVGVVVLDQPRESRVPVGWWLALGAAWSAWLALVAAGVVQITRRWGTDK